MKVSDQLIIQLLTEFEGKHMDPKTKMLSKAEGNFFVFRLNKSYVAFIPNQLFCYKDLSTISCSKQPLVSNLPLLISVPSRLDKY